MHGREMRLLNEDVFVPFKNCLDNRMKELSAMGKRVQRKQAEIITVEEENKMWNTSVLGTDIPPKACGYFAVLVGCSLCSERWCRAHKCVVWTNITSAVTDRQGREKNITLHQRCVEMQPGRPKT